MSTTVSCPKCGAQLAYRGAAGSQTRPCPKCGTPIAFVVMDPAPAPIRRAEEGEAPSVAPTGPPMRIELPQPRPAPEAKSPMPVAAAVEPARPRPKSINVLIPIGVGAGVMLLNLFLCGGVTVFLIAMNSEPSYSGDDFGYEYEPYTTPQTVYSPPAYDPYASPTTSDYSSGAYGESPSYDYSTATTPDYGAETASYEATPVPYVETDYSAPAADPPVSGLWNFDGVGREAELELAIQQDQAKVDELDGQMLLTGGFGIVSGIVSEMGETTDDRITGEIGEQGAGYVYSQLQIERDAAQARLDANRAELARLQSGN